MQDILFGCIIVQPILNHKTFLVKSYVLRRWKGCSSAFLCSTEYVWWSVLLLLYEARIGFYVDVMSVEALPNSCVNWRKLTASKTSCGLFKRFFFHKNVMTKRTVGSWYLLLPNQQSSQHLKSRLLCWESIKCIIYKSIVIEIRGKV